MADTSARVPRDWIAAAVAECLRAPGRPVRDLPRAARRAGDRASLPFAGDPVWHTKPEIDRCVAARLKLDAGRVAGPLRDDSELYVAVAAAISSLRRAGIIQDWKAGSGLGVWRLTGRPLPPPAADLSLSTAKGGPFSGGDAAGPAGRRPQLYCVFTGIIESGRKDNTYKFALARALLEYCHTNQESGNSRLVVPYRYLAMRFAEYYSRLDRTFGLRQTLHKSNTPAAVSAVRRAPRAATEFGPYHTLDAASRARIEAAVRRSVFGHARTRTSMVVPRFQNVECRPGGGARWKVKANPVFYDYSDDDQEIRLKPEAFRLFRDSYHTLMWAVLDGWARYIQKANSSERVGAAIGKALGTPQLDLVAESPMRPALAPAACPHRARVPAADLYETPARLAAWSLIFNHDMNGRARPCPLCSRPAPVQMPPAPPCLCLPVGGRRAA